jgi:hypothetical protein
VAYIYSVKSRVNKEVVSAWEKFFVEKHLDDLVETGCFTHYDFRKLQSDDPMSAHYISNYYYETPEHLEKYLTDFADELRQDVISRFKGKYQAARELYTILAK